MTGNSITIDVQDVMGRLERIETILEILSRQRTVKEFYTTEEIATIMGKAPFTVREWCRQGRVIASKRNSGRGRFKEWIISHEELMRLQSQGLLPPRSQYRHLR
jgi:hypothetical protein